MSHLKALLEAFDEQLSRNHGNWRESIHLLTPVQIWLAAHGKPVIDPRFVNLTDEIAVEWLEAQLAKTNPPPPILPPPATEPETEPEPESAPLARARNKK